MKMISSLRGGLLLTSACAVLAACSGSGSVENAGNTGSVTINPGNGGGGGQTTADGAVDFTTQLCPDGTTEGTRTVGGVDITASGMVVEGYDEAPVSAHMRGQEIVIDVDIGLGRGKATVWTCDLTHGYIEINADYRS